MSDHTLNTIEIKNFKCFENLHLEGLQRVNLIGGKNNVGKTAFMEAVELLVSSSTINDFLYFTRNMVERRQKNNENKILELDFINEQSSSVEIKSDNSSCSIAYLEDGSLIKEINLNKELISGPYLTLTSNKNRQSVSIDKLMSYKYFLFDTNIGRLKKVHFVSSETSKEHEIAILYGFLIDLNKESFLNDSLKLFDDNIVSLKQKATDNGIVLKVEVKNRPTPILLSSLGDGVSRYIAILCAIWASQDGFLFIDEIENGIHYTNYDKLWHIIFAASKEANCQLFITTHSKECIESFNRESDSENGAYFEFVKNKKNNKISAHKRDNEQLGYALSHQGSIRGE